MSARLARRSRRRGRSRPPLAASGTRGHSVERALEQRAGLAVGVHALGGVGGADRRHERLALRAGRQVVVRDAGGDQRVLAALRGLVLERARERAGAARRARRAAGRRGRPRAAARGGTGSGRAASATITFDSRRLAQRGAHLGGVEPARLGEHGVRRARARRRAPAATSCAGCAEPLDPHHQRVAQRARQPAATVEPRGEQLLGEQRVALAARVQALEQLGVGARRRGCRSSRSASSSRGQARELDPARRAVSRSSSASSGRSGWRRCSSSER